MEEPPSGFELAAEQEPTSEEPVASSPGPLISATDELSLEDGAAHVAPPVEQVDTDDLAFLEFTEPPVEPQAVTELTPAEPVDLAPVEEAPAPEKPKATRPPLFGFDFDGGSFLGGMPLPLNTPAPAPLKPPVPVSRDVAFDARATPPSGLSATVAAKPVMRKTEPPVTPAPVAPPSVVPPGPPAATPPPSTTRRPVGPPAPSPGKSRASAAPPSRTGLETDAPAPFGQSPSVQQPTRPTQGKTARPRPSPGRVATSNFSVPARPNGSADIFSQASSPIGVEVFGAPIPNPDQIVIPDIKKTAKSVGSGDAANPGVTAAQPVKKTRSSRLPLLIMLLIALPAAFWFLSNRFVPVSSQIVGTLKFNSFEADSPDAENFRQGQEARLQSPDVRQEAMTILKRQNVPPGFIADEEQYTGIVSKQNLTWNPNGSLDLTYHTSDPVRGRLRVDAILSALKEKDQDLQDLRDRTLATRNAATASRTKLEAEGKRLAARHLELATRAERRPDGLEMEQAKSEVKAARLKWTDAQAMLQSSRDALAKLQNQDPNVPPDIDADPQIVKLKKELALLDDQVRARKSGSINSSTPHGLGTDVPIGATTQPDNTGDSVLADLQDRIALQQKKLDNRLAELSALRAMGPAQRQVNLDKQKENLSISISKLSGDEQLAKSAYDNAAAKLAGLDDQMKDAVIAEASKEEVKEQMSQNNQVRSKALLDETDAEQKLASCVTVAHLNGEPNPRIGPAVVQADLRTPAFCMSTAISCFVLGILILGEIRRPKLITNVRRPDAAPLINQPMRVVPWPQPRQLEGLNEAPAVEEMAV